jgi:hypothetical protein
VGWAYASLTDLLLQPAPNGPRVVVAPYETELKRTMSRATDFPATATTPGFTYKYNPDLSIYERSSTSLGPAFLERADTVGKGRGDIGASYLHADFQELDGDDLDGLERGVLSQDLDVLDATVVTFDELDLFADAFYFSGTYGFTDRLDANVLVPVFYTRLDNTQLQTTTAFGNFSTSGDDDVAGPGDLQLRGKYRFDRDNWWVKSAFGLSLRVPTGSEDDFQGVGDVTLTPSVVLNRAIRNNDLHLSFGTEINPKELDRSRATYGIGASLGLLARLTINADIIGTSQFNDEDVSRFVSGASPSDVNEIRQVLPDVTVKSAPGGSDVVFTLDRQDVVDLAVGFKVNPFGKVVLFTSFIVPLTDDGIRTDFIPAFGIESSF